MSAALAHADIPPPDDDPSPQSQMSFLEHLEEFRTRIIRSCVAIAMFSHYIMFPYTQSS